MKRPELTSIYPVITPAFRECTNGVEGDAVCELSDELRVFYDPTGVHADKPMDEFVENVAATRAHVNLPGLGPISGHEVIAAETTHALIEGMDAVPLDLSERRRREITEATARQAGKIARAVIEAADGIVTARNTDQAASPFINVPTLPPRLVISGKVLAAVAHQHVRRRSGRAYYAHPDEVSSIITVAWRKQYGNVQGGMESMVRGRESMLDVIRFLSYAHDAFEDTIDPRSKYLAKPLIVTPLVAEKLLRSERVKDARDIARTLLFMTRTKDVEGRRMTYRDYVDNGIRRGGEYFILTKSPDIKHNVSIEPENIVPGDTKSAEKARKREMYKDAIVQILRGSDPYETSFVAHSVFTVTAEEVAAETRQKYPFDINSLADQVHDKLATSKQGAA
jgi:hypothetical protein